MRLPRSGSTNPLVPVALVGLLITGTTMAALLAPAQVRAPVTLAVATVLVLLLYVWRPKPALLVFALFVLFQHTFARWLSPSLQQVDEAVMPGLVLLAAWRLKPWRRGLFHPVREGAVVVLVVAGVASSVVSGVPLATWLLGLVPLVKVIAFLYVVLWHDFSSDDVRQFMPLMLAVGAVLLILGAVELLDATGLRTALNLTDLSTPRGQLPSIKSLFYHPVLFSWFMSFLALFLFAAYAVFQRGWLLVAALLFSLGTLLGARRRTIVGLLVALAAGLLAHLRAASGWRPVGRQWIRIAIGLVLIVVVFLPGLIGLYELTRRETDPGSGLPPGEDQEGRIALYTTSLLIARDHFPLGAGLGRYGSDPSRDDYSPVYERYGLDQIIGLSREDPRYITDTFWPRILGETGVLGLLAYVVFTATIGFALWRASQLVDADPLLRAFALGAVMVFVEALVETLASSMFDSPPRVYLLFGAVAMTLSLARGARARTLDGAAATQTAQPEALTPGSAPQP